MTSEPLTTCLWFDDQAEEAARFYTGVFKDAAMGDIHRYTEAGPGMAGTVMLAEFELNGQKFTALNGGPQHFGFNEAVSFCVTCADQAEVDYYWEALLDGRRRTQRLRLAQRQVRRALAGRAGGVLRDGARRGPGPQGAGNQSHALHGQVRHRRPGGGLRRRVTR